MTHGPGGTANLAKQISATAGRLPVEDPDELTVIETTLDALVARLWRTANGEVDPIA